ncbi:MAG TPA: DUF885 family protein, partial [Candidatus Glassbacteria bacterium]|nr:DUF885 family protein [Candidatus Glassbacteria bacterium]
RDAELVTLPASDNLEVYETPLFERAVIQTAGYIEAPIFEEGSCAYFCVTPPDKAAGQEEVPARLFSRREAILMVLRELYPGRHTLLLHRRKNCDGKLAYLARGNVVEQGWRSYAVNLAAEEGLFDDPAIMVHAWHDRLVSAWRVLVDLDLHTGVLDESQAVTRLAAGTALTEKAAWGQVAALAANPASSIASLAGWIQIEDWRSKYRKKKGRAYSVKKFHDHLLRLSVLPPAEIEKRLVGKGDGRKK